jgi:energy-coupling factor transporter ATP-binding protein EcfA2
MTKIQLRDVSLNYPSPLQDPANRIFKIQTDRMQEDLPVATAAGIRALDHVNLKVSNGRTFVVIGPSGCGKSTLLRVVAGLINDYSGEVLYDEEDVDLAARVGMQAPSLYSYFSSKHDIYDAMFAEGARAMGAHEIEQLDDASTIDGLRYMAHYFVDFCVSDPVRYQLLFQRTIPGFEPSAEAYAVSVAELARAQAWFTLHGIGHALDMYTALITGIVDQQLSNDPGGDRWIRLVDEAMEMFLTYAEGTRPKKRSRK